jgi:hypothetical protein
MSRSERLMELLQSLRRRILYAPDKPQLLGTVYPVP